MSTPSSPATARPNAVSGQDGDRTGPEGYPQAGRERIIAPQPVAMVGDEQAMAALVADFQSLGPDRVFMMGDNPDLPRMPKAPRLLDFFRLRFHDLNIRHLVQSAKLALDGGHEEKVVVACLLHDIAHGGLMRTDHGYWGAQMIEPYVSEEIAWAVRYHQALRYFPDEAVGYEYPESYVKYFGHDYQPPEYIVRAHQEARAHRWYMTSRLVTLNDEYSFRDDIDLDLEQFADALGRHFREPEEGLGFDNSPSAHMWRTIIWPHNFL